MSGYAAEAPKQHHVLHPRCTNGSAGAAQPPAPCERSAVRVACACRLCGLCALAYTPMACNGRHRVDPKHDNFAMCVLRDTHHNIRRHCKQNGTVSRFAARSSASLCPSPCLKRLAPPLPVGRPLGLLAAFGLLTPVDGLLAQP
eukprot:scaffold28945_cov112-Isochrysis_galbana.AAC.1